MSSAGGLSTDATTGSAGHQTDIVSISSSAKDSGVNGAPGSTDGAVDAEPANIRGVPPVFSASTVEGGPANHGEVFKNSAGVSRKSENNKSKEGVVVQAKISENLNNDGLQSLDEKAQQLTVIDGPVSDSSHENKAMTDGNVTEGSGSIARLSVVEQSGSVGTHNNLYGEATVCLENGRVGSTISDSGTIDADARSGNGNNIDDNNEVDMTSPSDSEPIQRQSSDAGKLVSESLDSSEKIVHVPKNIQRSESSPPAPITTSSNRELSPKRTAKSARERVNSSQDLVDAANNLDHDEEDDDENEIPPHILNQSTIVEKSPAERYIRFKEKLGSGAYKDVYRAYDTIEGIEVAWNVVKLGGVPKAERVRIVNEVRLLERLHHPNIISFHGSWVNRETERVIFVTEILSSGTLKSFVQKVQLIRWKIFKRWAIQILKGLEYLHSQDPPIIHRDLKCDNIFINGTSGDLRIGDFGLSTAISKKNQPLSVLGTPEFMAPELYDENYDEKVDIYAFGMLLLEIITRDIPYQECTNPAQIYKKVTQGIPPASLRRVKSEDARDLILFCLGIGEEASSRPSASELLQHPFLAKRSDDDATIEVEPAVEDIVIDENQTYSTGVKTVPPKAASKQPAPNQQGNSMTFSDTTSEHSSCGDKYPDRADSAPRSNTSKYVQDIDGHEIPSKKGTMPANPVEQVTPKEQSVGPPKQIEKVNSMHSEDHFGAMPENEANMKRVTVLMGRGTTLEEEDTQSSAPATTSDSIPPPNIVKAPLSRNVSEVETISLNSTVHYKVSALPKDEVLDGSKPYPNDTINLALTLPDESQTTIEFEFDLVNDDPVQVAREMVTELDEVPEDAVLDISEAISGVARQARMKQNQWAQLQQQNFLALQALQQQGIMMHPQGPLVQPQGIQPQGLMMHQQQQPPIGGQLLYGSGYPVVGYQNPTSSMVPPHLGASSDASVGPASTALQQQQQHQPQHIPLVQPAPAPPSQIQPQQHPAQQQKPPLPQPPQHQQQHQQTPQQQIQTHQQSIQVHQQIQTPGASIPQSSPQYPGQSTVVRSNSVENTISTSEVLSSSGQGVTLGQHLQHKNPNFSNSTVQDGMTTVPSNLDSSIPVQQTQNLFSMTASSSLHYNEHNPLNDTPTILPKTTQSIQSIPESTSTGLSIDEGGSDVEDDSVVDTEEIRKLELEFEKKMQRAKKSYGTRMDNLHRSKEEAEAQHQMTLEKHEKERIEFEKRVRLAEEEQNRRLNQIQKEFIEKKHQVRQQRSRHAGIPNGDKPPLHGGHKRSSSHFDSSLQQQPLSANVSEHRRTNSCSDGVSETDQRARAPPSVSSLGETAGQPGQNGMHPNKYIPMRQTGNNPMERDRSESTSS
ncbi:hypothetical protein ACHAXS_014200 [Conticribra weissflogii]